MEIILSKLPICHDAQLEIAKYLTCSICNSMSFSRYVTALDRCGKDILCCKCWSNHYWILYYSKNTKLIKPRNTMFVGTGAQLKIPIDIMQPPPREEDWRTETTREDNWRRGDMPPRNAITNRNKQQQKMRDRLVQKVSNCMKSSFKWSKVEIDTFLGTSLTISYINPAPNYSLDMTHTALVKVMEEIIREEF
jgi:hypothetical protein